MLIKYPRRKLHPPEWYLARDRRGPGKKIRKWYKLNRLQRLFKFAWAQRKIWGAKNLWKALAMRPGLERHLAETETAQEESQPAA